ncbi:Stigma-specific protein Stig1 [Melia azedarach]|uniref:Stigma-specific protein Stig1 n=2 Tax=Melia azedarach TaxID=155640 RepID=A0ACC1WYC4_MELAZ|nr:Stigma-specific protein Stig1 [Melia azedarach]KAJ4703949.1 Stigma-specific protein Stig1 [Melia azedarach]
MKFLTLFFALAATFAIVATENNLDRYNYEDRDQQKVSEMQEATSMRGISRFLAQQNLIVNITCDKFPRVCRLKNSPGPDCCKKKCVNVKTDRFNCGMCGYKCKYTEICCKGKCVNASFDKRHCGGCNKKCKKESSVFMGCYA